MDGGVRRAWNLNADLNGGFPCLNDNPPPASSTSSPPAASPPTLILESVTVDRHTAEVAANLGWNPVANIQASGPPAFVEERAAIEAGASLTGAGAAPTDLVHILSGAGVGLGPGVTPHAAGLWAAFYEHLGILPNWTGTNTTSVAAGVAALLKAHARWPSKTTW
jgi:hypothetical protein